MPLSSARYWPAEELVFTVSVKEVGAFFVAEGVSLAELDADGVPVAAEVAALVAGGVMVGVGVPPLFAGAAAVVAAAFVAVAALVAVDAFVGALVAVADGLGVPVEVASPVVVTPVSGTTTAAVAVGEFPAEDAQPARNSMPITSNPTNRKTDRYPLFFRICL